MKRTILKRLLEWKKSRERKPLILQGARQVGKTFILKEFADENFTDFHYFDLEKLHDEVTGVFEGTAIDPVSIIQKLEFISNRKINLKEDIVIFDEIQAVPRAITSLKYFCEEMSELALMTAGSNLGVALSETPFPVGKVKCMTMYPMTFMEFLQGTGEDFAYDFLKNFNFNTKIENIYHEKLLDLLKRFFISGGLPEVVNCYREKKENLFDAFTEVRKLQKQLIIHYQQDFSKYSGHTNARHIERVFKSVPNQLSSKVDKSSGKFKFKDVISRGYRSYDALADPIDWLLKAGLIIKLPILENPFSPIAGNSDESRFKLMLFDIGILGAMVNLSPKSVIMHDYGSYKGYFVENYILQELTALEDFFIANWQGRTSEVEFIIENSKGIIIPVEVKAGTNTRSKSLDAYMAKYSPEFAVRFSAKKSGKKGILHTFPLYMTEQCIFNNGNSG